MAMAMENARPMQAYNNQHQKEKEKSPTIEISKALFFGVLGATVTIFAGALVISLIWLLLIVLKVGTLREFEQINRMRRTVNGIWRTFNSYHSQEKSKAKTSYQSGQQYNHSQTHSKSHNNYYEEYIKNEQKYNQQYTQSQQNTQGKNQQYSQSQSQSQQSTRGKSQQNSQGQSTGGKSQQSTQGRSQYNQRNQGSSYKKYTPPSGQRSTPLSENYSVLGLDRNRLQPYTDTEIKAAFQKKAHEYHPDHNRSKKEYAEKKFKELNAAREAIFAERKYKK